jgi:hypothetical protein
MQAAPSDDSINAPQSTTGDVMTSLDDLLDRTLPLNRKERYYTGTVLPAIICCDNFAHFSRISSLLPTGDLDVRAVPDDCTIIFFTEYGLAESAIGESASRFTTLPTAKDTPDVVVLVTRPQPVLIALEAKLYDRPSKPDLQRQLGAQAILLEHMVGELGRMLGEAVRLVHAALLPEALAAAMGDLSVQVITWEQFRSTFSDVAPPYFDAMLATAIRRYPQLVSRWAGYQDAEIAGEQLVQRYRDGDRTYPWMGRGDGGLFGTRVAADVRSGNWRHHRYQCAKTEIVNNSNWFAVADFITLLRDEGQLPPAPSVADELE